MSEGLAIEGLSAGYRHRTVLHALTISPISSGSVVAIVGPNGAGKSTLLRAIAGLVPASGRIALDDVDLLALSPSSRANYLGFMPQSMPAGIGLTVIESVIGALKVSNIAIPTREVREQAATVIRRLGIGPLAMEPLDRLSGGQRQMASLAQAIAIGPRVLLLDEPTSALDLRHQFHVLHTIRGLADEKRAVIIVMHDLGLAAQWADRIIVMQAGRVHTDGTAAEAITPRMLSTVYGISARVERCSLGRLQILSDGLAEPGHPIFPSGDRH
ncbi:MAG: iron ABC transporter [Bradyrhizobiaceae bacterium PARB1]|jgi:iron complex transport system ATP-binding protein|nr:MAG: iron ABC transporter [Bradyrhizobiaceae bacterium PARB1]